MNVAFFLSCKDKHWGNENILRFDNNRQIDSLNHMGVQ